MKVKATVMFEIPDDVDKIEEFISKNLGSALYTAKNEFYGSPCIENAEVLAVENDQPMEEKKLFCPYCGGRAEVVASPPTSYSHHPWFCKCKVCSKEFTLDR